MKHVEKVEQPKAEKPFDPKPGTVWGFPGTCDTYILHLFQSKYTLIGLDGRSRWTDPSDTAAGAFGDTGQTWLRQLTGLHTFDLGGEE